MSLSYTSASLIALLLEDGVALGDGRCETLIARASSRGSER